jgi:hypothetical protein
MMNRQELQAEFSRIQFQINTIKQNTGIVPDELISLGCQQVCVSICGSLEQCLKKIFVEYAKQRSERRIYRPIEKICESYQNPKTTKILELIALFDADYERSLSEQWEKHDNIEKSHIGNLIDDRITIAHRKRLHINISTGKLDNYYNAYSNLLTRIYEKFLS